eukprot:5987733-Pyramimonas_sp.AAC.1
MIHVIVAHITRAGMPRQEISGTRMETMVKETWHSMLRGWRRREDGREHCVLRLGREQCC